MRPSDSTDGVSRAAALGGAGPGAGKRADAEAIEAEARRALASGDTRRALAVLMDGFGDSLFQFCANVLSDEALARDVHQLTFVRAYESLASFSGRSSLRTWLFGIARHRALDALKSRRRATSHLDPQWPPPERPADGALPDERLELDRLARLLARCLQQLRPKVRMAVLLRYREELTYEEMAEVADERPATLQARVARSLPVLRRCVEQGA